MSLTANPAYSSTCCIISALLSISLLSQHATAVSFRDIGTLPGSVRSTANAVSADGSVVVGDCFFIGQGPRAFRWTQAGGMQDLGPGEATAVNADGSVVVGWAPAAAGETRTMRAFRWTQAGGMQDLGPSSERNAQASAVSADGLVVVGTSSGPTTDQPGRAFRWTQASGMQFLDVLPDFTEAYSVGASADCATIIGNLLVRGVGHAFRWTQAEGVQLLASPPELKVLSVSEISDDGKVVLGTSNLQSTSESVRFRWTQAQGFEIDPNSRQRFSWIDVNLDGSVIVGHNGTGNSHGRALLWTQKNGLQDLNDLRSDFGLDPDRWTLARAHGASANGRTIVGYSLFSEISNSIVGPVTNTVQRAFVISGFPSPLPQVTSSVRNANGFSLSWAPAYSVHIQWRYSMDQGEWTTVSTNNTNGVFRDTNAPTDQAFYRLLIP